MVVYLEIEDFEGNSNEFNYDENELRGLIKINAKKALEILKNQKGQTRGTYITRIDNQIVEQEKDIEFKDFLINKGETGLGKYGKVLEKIIELTNN